MRGRPKPTRQGSRISNVVLLAVLGGALGLLFAGPLAGVGKIPVELPLPHVKPTIAGGTSLRFAMVHDVVHERYPRHGRAYYEARNRASRATIEAAGEEPATPELLDAYDDLGAGLDRTGEPARAVEVLREKARRLRERYPEPPAPLPAGEPDDFDVDARYRRMAEGLAATERDPARRAYYRTWANLGTFLIHASFRDAIGGDAAAKANLHEGTELIARAIAVNPGAHFGREAWQFVAANFVAAALERPELLTRYDLVGDALGQQVDAGRASPKTGIPYAYRSPEQFAERSTGAVREFVTPVGGEGAWAKDVPAAAEALPAAFDEPVLGILGMWMLGGGPNPHFALALGGIMERVGQRYLAFAAYSRALSMADRFWPDPAVRDALTAHCQQRREALAATLPESLESLQAQFDRELAAGLAYQEAYQAFEEERLAAGADLLAEGAYDAFHDAHPIATPPGKSDVYYLARDHGGGVRLLPVLAAALLGAGLLSWLGLLLPSSRR